MRCQPASKVQPDLGPSPHAGSPPALLLFLSLALQQHLSPDAPANARFADRPGLLKVYNALAVPILKADLLRCLLLHAEDDVRFNLDTSCAGVALDVWVPSWVPAALAGRAALVVGWEFDAGSWKSPYAAEGPRGARLTSLNG